MRKATHNLFLVGAVFVLASPANTSPTTKDGCPSEYFPCYMDCCKTDTWFCNKEPTEERCQPCEFQKEWCGTEQLDKDCRLYCYKLEVANSALTPNTTIPPAAESSNNDGSLPSGFAEALIVIAVILTCVLFAMLWWLLRHRRNGTRPDFTFCCQKKRRIVKEGSNRSASGSTVTEGGSVNSTEAVDVHSPLTQVVTTQGKPEETNNEESESLLGITTHSSNDSVIKMGAAQEVRPAYEPQTTTKNAEAVPVRREAPSNPNQLVGGRIAPVGQSECVCRSATSGDVGQNVNITVCHHGGCQGTTSPLCDVQQSNIPRRIPTAHPAAAGQMNHDGFPLATDQADCPPRSNVFTPNQHSAFSASASRQDIHVNNTAGATATTASSVNATPTIAHDAAGAAYSACSRSTHTESHVCRDSRLITNPTPSSEGEDHSIAIDHVKPTQLYMSCNPHVQQEIGDHHTNWPS